MRAPQVMMALTSLLVAILVLSTSAQAVLIEGDGVIFRLDNCDITWNSDFEPYYVAISNDTATFADDGGEFSLRVWATGQIYIDMLHWGPYSTSLLHATIVGTGADASFRFSGVQPGSTWRLTVNDEHQSLTASIDGAIDFSLLSIDSEDIWLSYQSSPPAFTNSPDSSVLDFTPYYYRAEVWPTGTTVSVITKPHWLTWNKYTNELHGTPRLAGAYDCSLLATNQHGQTYLNWTITVYADGPAITSNPPLVVNKFDDYSYRITATPSYLTLTPLEYPSWLSWNPYTSTLSGKAIRAGTFDVSIRASNPDGVVYQNFTITVNDLIRDPDWSDGQPRADYGSIMLYVIVGAAIAFVLLVFAFVRRR